MGRAASKVFLVLALAALAGGASAADDITVGVNHSRRVMLHGVAANVIVGDPAIADVSMIDAHSIVVLGRGYGATDVVVLDRAGRTLLDSQILVSAPDDNRVTVHHGATAIDFSCSPRCQAITPKEGAPTPPPPASGMPPQPSPAATSGPPLPSAAPPASPIPAPTPLPGL